MFDNEAERTEYRVPINTTSLWSFLEQPSERRNITNALYAPVDTLLRVCWRAPAIKIWLRLYGQSTYSFEHIDEAFMAVQAWHDTKQVIHSEVVQLEAQLEELRQQVPRSQENGAQSHENGGQS